jgi:hypothetical protein
VPYVILTVAAIQKSVKFKYLIFTTTCECSKLFRCALQSGKSVIDSRQERKPSSAPSCPALSDNVHRKIFPRGKKGRDVNIITHYHLEARLGMTGGVPPLLHTLHGVK